MPRRQSISPLEQVLLTRHVVPWWLYVLLAALCWLGLYLVGQWVIPSSQAGDDAATLLHSFALVGQVLVPLALLCAGIADLFNRVSRRRRMDRLQHEQVSERLLEELSWQEARDLIELALAGEGYSPGVGPVSGTDRVLQREGKRALLIMEFWRRPQLESVMMQQAFERAEALDADELILVCSGSISGALRTQARRNGIRLIDRGHLQQWLQTSAIPANTLN